MKKLINMKILKYIIFITAGITVALSIFYLITLSRMEFNFANNGKIICVIKKDWGIISKGDLTCFNISLVGEEKEQQTFKCNTLNEEIVIKK